MCDPHEFALRVFGLEMQSAQDATLGAAVIVLNEIRGVTDSLIKVTLVKAFKEKTALVTEHFGREQQHIGNVGSLYLIGLVA